MEIRDGFPRLSPFHKIVPSAEDIRRVCKRYHVGKLIAVHGGLGGLLNVNLKVETTGGMYALRVLSGFATEEHVEFTLRVIGILREAAIPALQPLRTPTGSSFVRWNDRLIMLTPFVEGHEFRSRVGQARASGEMLRRVHDALSDVEDGPKPGWSNYPSAAIMGEGLSRLSEMRLSSGQVSEARRLRDSVMSRWRTVCRDLPTTIIHGDWHPGNQLYTDCRVICILDFDFIQRAERLHDVAYALWSLLTGNPSRSLSRTFLEGYGPLEENERAALPHAIARAALFFVCAASFTSNPDEELEVQLQRQGPLIEWLLSSSGVDSISRLLPPRPLDRAA